LLRAFKLLRERGIDVELVMTGTAGTWVEALARRYGVGQGVRLLGRLPEGEYFRLMAGAGATVLPSVWPEPLPTVAVESISLGVPVVGSGLGGIPEIVDKYGVVAPPLPEKVAEAVAKVLDSRYDREEMSRYAFKKFGSGNVERSFSLGVVSEVAF
jgi:glycosyltransferase involved in cell wall biosynthesis